MFLQRRVFSFWLGPLEMSPNRKAAFFSIIENNSCANIHLRDKNLHEWIHPLFPLHPLFHLLSSVHQSDYLRCYFLHVYGGGYTDIKITEKSWISSFKKLEKSAAYGLGYTEIGPQGVAKVGDSLELEMQNNYSKLIGFSAMIFKPRSDFTDGWLQRIHEVIDKKANLLIKHPAKHPQDHLGVPFEGGYISEYPFAWTELGGNIFHPMVYELSDKIIHDNQIMPLFVNYR